LRGGIPDALESFRSRFLFLFGSGDDMRNIFGKRVECGIGVAPRIEELFGIELSDESCDFRKFEKARAGWNQQADRELNGGYGRDEIMIGNGFEKIEVARARSPWREWDKGWLQREGSVVAKIESTEEICAGVTLFEFKKDVIIEKFDGAGDKQAASARKRGESIGVTEKVFDFDGDVVGEMRMLCLEHFDNSRGVSNAVEKIGIAECDVLGAGFDLLANVGEDYFVRDDTKLPSVNRNDWAVAAEMFAAAGRFRVTGNAMRAAGQHDVSVFAQNRKSGAVWDFEGKVWNFCFRDFGAFANTAGLKVIRELRQFGFKLRTENGTENGRKSRCA